MCIESFCCELGAFHIYKYNFPQHPQLKNIIHAGDSSPSVEENNVNKGVKAHTVYVHTCTFHTTQCSITKYFCVTVSTTEITTYNFEEVRMNYVTEHSLCITHLEKTSSNKLIVTFNNK